MRLLIREEAGSAEFLTEENLLKISQFALEEHPSATQLPAKIESAKCLVNMIFKTPALADAMIKLQLHFKILQNLNPKTDEGYLFPQLRILFLLSRPVGDSDIYRKLADHGAIEKLYQILKFYIDDNPQFPDPRHYFILKEVLQLLFNLTIGMGSLNSKPNEPMDYQTYVPNYEEVVGSLLRVFGIPLESPSACPQLFDLKNCCLNCFVNIPLDYYRILVVLGDQTATLKSLFDLLEWEIRSDGGSEKKSIVTIFMVVQYLLSKEPDARPYAMTRLFPGRNLETEREESEKKGESINMDAINKDADTVGNMIIKYMSSMNMAIKFVANELLFSLVGENADDFVRLTGFGNAAGLLAMRNLFGMGKHLNRDTATEMREEKKKKMPDLVPAREGETEEEKEQRTMENIEKMVESGMIQLVKK
uniref:Uncharacterized protein n=1 Tax=Arcella intermedia TaxID=1963864 RepID=A0A6B2L560_9EUKA